MRAMRERRAPGGAADGGRAWRPSLGYVALAVVALAGGLAAMALSGSPAATASQDARASAATPSPVDPAAGGGLALADSAAGAGAGAVAGAGPGAVRPATPPGALAMAAAAIEPGPAAAPAATLPSMTTPRVREPGSDPTPDLADYLNPGEAPSMAEVIDRLHLAGVHSGLGAFSPPGTRPPRIGLAVPEDFPLPEGYVRHYQATDDGQRIEPILMFAPDRAFVDASGAPIAIPADRVVPPELAPPGLPLRQIVVPAPIDAGRPGR